MNEPPSGDIFRGEALRMFREWVLDSEFPCVGAKAAFNSEAHTFHVYDEVADPASTALLGRDLQRFTGSQLREESEYATFIAVFRAPVNQSEAEFEQRLWSQLAMLHEIDAKSWDSAVRADPADRHFSFSFAGQALYVIGLHANSSRIARRFPWPTLVFNPHEQFERLRADGKWKRMQQTIRGRDMQLQGSVNPMLSDFGETSEARQYSGRAVENDWRPPIGNGKCPFAH